jgi:hypothetical protein
MALLQPSESHLVAESVKVDKRVLLLVDLSDLLVNALMLLKDPFLVVGCDVFIKLVASHTVLLLKAV